jgi:class 3 adenylate cyclase
MSAILLTTIRKPAKTTRTRSADLAADTRAALGKLVQKHGGSVIHTKGETAVAWFEQSARALECALGLQGCWAERNSAAADGERLLVRMSVHVSEAANEQAQISDEEAKAASLILDATPFGRVFLSREAFMQSQAAEVCGFIPLGFESFTGREEPLEIFEAISVPAVWRH